MGESKVGRVFGRHLEYNKEVLSNRIIFQRKTRKARRVRYTEVIMTHTPHVQSRASYILLRDSLLKQDETYKKCQDWIVWARIKRKIIKKNQVTNDGIIKCEYCGKTLNPEFENHRDSITIDHIIPVSKGGSYFDEDNLAVVCGTCNVQKGNKIIKECE